MRKPPTGGADVAALKELLLWARQNRIALGTVQVGECSATVVDIGMTAEAPKAKTDRASLYAEYGGKAMEAFLADMERDAQGAEDEAEATS